ncbi:MAG: InlB B-repeat-containing protein, partial [Treponema sp.]|nr:InlB B-repeat-containing protein [Treponema sp.]
MKKFALKLIKSSTIFLLFSLFACNTGLNGVSSDREDKQSSATGSSNGVAYLSAVNFGAGGRAILPSESFDLKGKDIYKFVLKGKPVDGEEIVYEPWVQTSEEFAYDKMDNDLRDNKIALGVGIYTFTIQVYALPEGVTCSDEDADSKAFLALEKTKDSVEIKSGRNTIEFGTLEEVAGNGNLSLKVRFPDAGVQSVTVRMEPQNEGNTYSVAETALDISNDSATGYKYVVFNDNPLNGWYVVKFTFTMNNGAGDTTQVWSELVQIATGRKTQAEINIESLNAIYPIVPVFKCSEEKVRFKGEGKTFPLSYSPYQEAIEIPELESRNAATFVGWYSDPDYQNKVTEIPAGSKGTKTFYARWKYNYDEGKLYANGEKLIVQEASDSDTIVHAYFDEVKPDNAVLNDDGGLLNIYNWKVYGSKKDGTYPDGTTDNITVESGSLISVYANGTNGSVTVNGGTVRFIESTGTVNVNGGTILGDDNNGTSPLYAIKTTSANAFVNITGGTIKGNVGGTVEGGTLIKVSGKPYVGNKKNIGIQLSAARDKKIIAGNLNEAGNESITLIAPTAAEGTVLATFEGQAYTMFFAIINSDRKRNAQVVGNDVMVNGDLSLPTSLKADESDSNTFYVFGENVTKKGTIFSVFADGGYFNVGDTSLDGASFSMGIPLDANFKENGYADSVSTETNFRYIQFTSTGGDISSEKANAFLNKIKFHKIDNKPFKIRINLETVPIKDDKKGYELNKNIFYFDGSFYKKSEPFDNGTKVSWQQAYNKAKEERFNGLQGYLMTITSDAENKFIYDQVFKAEREKGQTPDDFGSWIGGTRQKPKVDYDLSTWEADGFNKYWSWACGPDAGKVFYTNTFSRDGQDYRAEGMYSAWSNPEDCKKNGIPRAYAGDYEPNNESNANYTGGDNSDTAKEVYLQYTGHYVWNDASTGNGSQGRWKIHYYIVEFTPYENPVAGIAIPTDPAV